MWLNGRYRLAERLASGGMGDVWRGVDELLGRQVAVKMLKHEYASDTTFRDRFRAEARNTAALAHPGIAQVYDYGEQGGGAYLVMELVPGHPLSDILARNGKLTGEVTLDIIGQAASALQAAHNAGLIHRDIKPGNLLITPDGVVKVTDFGIARASKSSTLTQTGMVMGTAHYVSPEQAEDHPLTPASDLYSLGVVAYECLTGQPPFDADTPVAIALRHVRDDPPPLPVDTPEPVQELIAQILAKDPQDRPADGGEVANRASVVRDAIALAQDEAESEMSTTLPALIQEVSAQEDAPEHQSPATAVEGAEASVEEPVAGSPVGQEQGPADDDGTAVQTPPGGSSIQDVLAGVDSEPASEPPPAAGYTPHAEHSDAGANEVTGEFGQAAPQGPTAHVPPAAARQPDPAEEPTRQHAAWPDESAGSWTRSTGPLPGSVAAGGTAIGGFSGSGGYGEPPGGAGRPGDDWPPEEEPHRRGRRASWLAVAGVFVILVAGVVALSTLWPSSDGAQLVGEDKKKRPVRPVSNPPSTGFTPPTLTPSGSPTPSSTEPETTLPETTDIPTQSDEPTSPDTPPGDDGDTPTDDPTPPDTPTDDPGPTDTPTDDPTTGTPPDDGGTGEDTVAPHGSSSR